MRINLFLIALLLSVPANAQRPGSVTWNASAEPASGSGVINVNVTAQVERGWHIYAQTQAPGGPTPLRIALDPGSSYELSGSITGTKPLKHHDTSFDLDTEFYTDALTLNIPVKLRGEAGAGIPFAVRYQMCSDTVCMPPKTTHIVAQVTGR